MPCRLPYLRPSHCHSLLGSCLGRRSGGQSSKGSVRRKGAGWDRNIFIASDSIRQGCVLPEEEQVLERLGAEEVNGTFLPGGQVFVPGTMRLSLQDTGPGSSLLPATLQGLSKGSCSGLLPHPS